MLESEKEFALSAVKAAAAICRRVQSGIALDSLDKKDRSPVTVADFAVQALISGLLAEHFPDDKLVGEEGADQLREASAEELRNRVVAEVQAARDDDPTSETVLNWIDRGQAAGGAQGRFWVLDPIDGTKGFLRKEQYAIALALIENGQVQLGVLGCPNLPESMDQATGPDAGYAFVAVKGEGTEAAKMPADGTLGDLSPIAVSSSDDPASARRCESVESGHASHDEMAQIAEKAQMTGEPVRLDSQAKYATVARGESVAYLRLSPDASYTEKIWDHAAGEIVVTEAGGVVTDLLGKPLDFTQGRGLVNNRGIIATNAALHERVVRATAEVLGF